MTDRIRTALRTLLATWDEYSAQHLNAPLTHELVRSHTVAVAR